MIPCVLTGQVKRLADLLQLNPHCESPRLKTGRMFTGRLHIYRNKLPGRGLGTLATLYFPFAFTVNMFAENLSSALSFISFQGLLVFLVSAVGGSAGAVRVRK